MRDERGERRPQPGLLRLAERDDRAAAALDEQRRLAAEEDDLCAGDTGSSAARPLRPRQLGAVGLGRIGGGDHERLGLLAFPRPELAQPLDRAAEGELGAAEPLDEVAAPAEPERLERLQLAVDRAVAAGDPLRPDAVASDDPLPLEQELGERAPVGLAREEACRSSDQRPWVAVIAVERRREKRRGRRSGSRDAVAPPGPQRRPGVVRDLARPDEVPERRQRLLGLELGRREQVEPELGAAAEHLANPVVQRLLRARSAAARRPSAGASSRK